ncbi:hypothetical protein RLIN73S_05586 [Rhodanobacter lindaniclasticus]
MRQHPVDHAAVVGAVAHLRHWPGAQVEIARQAGVAAAVLGSGPDAVVGHRQRIGVDQPGMALGLVREGAGRGQHVADHPRQERRLRTGQVVGAVGVEHTAVMRDLEQHVVGHVAGECDATVGEQAELDEVAVPAIHLVELPARHHVRPGQVEQPFGRQRRRHQVAQPLDAPGQRVHVDLAALPDRVHVRRHGQACRQVEHRGAHPIFGSCRAEQSSSERVSVSHAWWIYACVLAGSGVAACTTLTRASAVADKQGNELHGHIHSTHAEPPPIVR